MRAAFVLFLLLVLPGSPAPGRESIFSGSERFERVLILAPHCDDETLCCAGPIASVLKAQGQVLVVFVTNGDAYTLSAEEELNKFKPGPQDYIRLGIARQKEALGALKALGLGNDSSVFLGFPDRGIEKILLSYWDPRHPYTSRYTRSRSSPYELCYEKGVVYCGKNLLKNLEDILERFKPTTVLAPHPDDQHPDHWACNAFINLALAEARMGGDPWARKVNLFGYLTHWKKWPEGNGLHVKSELMPPKALINSTLEWIRFPLTPELLGLKFVALQEYESQLKAGGGYLLNFLRANEIFCSLPPCPLQRIANQHPVIDGRSGDWEDIEATLHDPLRRTVLKSLEKGGEIDRVYVCADEKNFYFRIDTLKKPSSSTDFELYLYPLEGKGPVQPFDLRIHGKKKSSASLPLVGVEVAIGDILEIGIPRVNLGSPRGFLFSVVSRRMNLTIDRSTFCLVEGPDKIGRPHRLECDKNK